MTRREVVRQVAWLLAVAVAGAVSWAPFVAFYLQVVAR